ncbi:MAG TPA: MBL fold metallo-hydrolase [Pyrinomonadaceae bacterium]|nr:MBL fold metallo-hydrolase [Pyrinomonadaceae bacterium]
MADLTIDFLDVGQGDGTFIQFPDGSTMLIDLGSTKNAAIVKTESLVFFKSIWEMGEEGNVLDYLMLTHGDQDHYNLVEELFDDYELDVGEIYIGGAEDDYQVGGFAEDFLKPRRNKLNLFSNDYSSGFSPWKSIGGADIYVLAVNFPRRLIKGTNRKSLVLLLAYEKNSIILGGDATKATEKEIIRYYTKLNSANLLKSKFMKVNHHGSETSSSVEWIRALAPEYAFVSADMHDGYLLPRCAVIDRILAQNTIDRNYDSHPYLCFDKGRDDWKNNPKSTNAIFNTLAGYTDEVWTPSPVKKKKQKKPPLVRQVVGHGVRFTLTFKAKGGFEITHTEYPKIK